MRRFTFILICGLLAGACAAEADDGAFHEPFRLMDNKRWYLSDGWTNGDHQSCEWKSGEISITGGGLQMRLTDDGGKIRKFGCSEMHTVGRLGYGLYEARMKTAAGSGLNTAFFTYVGPPVGNPQHDEIDFEFLGKNSQTVDINYFTNGKSQLGKPIQLGFDASQDFHDYAFDWAPDKITWYVDGKTVYETPPGADLPHNPGRLYLSLWSSKESGDAWMGAFKYTAPVTAEVAWTAFTPAGAPCQFPESMKCK